MGMLISLVVLSCLIFFHELGHFLAARFFGVKIEVFSIGFGKKIFSKTINQTQYCISAIPLGGYVQMKGQDDFDPNVSNFDNDGYSSKKPWQRVLMLFAGPFANFLLAFFLYVIIGHLGVLKLAPTIGHVEKNSAAFVAGFEKNDTIVSINQIPIKEWDDIRPIVDNSNDAIAVEILRDNKILLKNITPKLGKSKNMFGEDVERKLMGILPIGEAVKLHYKGFDSIKFAFLETYKATKIIFISLEKLIIGVVSPKEMGGIISIVKITSDAANIGIVALFILTALISVNLGVLNLLPIPALDGGHIAFNLYEMIAKKAPSQKIYTRLMYLGWVFLLGLMIFTIANDILRLTGGY